VLALAVVAGVLLSRREEEDPTRVPVRRRPSAPSRPEAPDPEHVAAPARPGLSDDEQLLTSLRGWAEEHPSQFDAIFQQYDAAIQRIRDPAVAAKAKRDVEQWRARRERAAEEAFAALQQRAEERVAAGDYDGALEVYSEVPPALLGSLAERVAKAQEEIDASATANVTAAIREVEELHEEGELAQALAALDAVKDVKYAPLADRVRALRSGLEAAAEDAMAAAAADAVADLLAAIEVAVAEGDLLGVGQLVEEAKADEVLAAAGGQVAAVVAVGEALARAQPFVHPDPAELFRTLVGREVTVATAQGPRTGRVTEATEDAVVLVKTFKIGGEERRREYRIAFSELGGGALSELAPKWTPETADEHIAAAILALAEEDEDAAKAALARAEGHPLHERYNSRLAAASADGAEVEAAETERRIPVWKKWPFGSKEARLRQQKTATILGVPVEKAFDLGDDVTLEMVLVPAGRFVMGSPSREKGRESDEFLRRVTIKEPFYMGKYEVTQRQWKHLMRRNPCQRRDPEYPVDRVSWQRCQEFIARLNKRGVGTFRLPTEAEWEYACRAGTATPFHFRGKATADRVNLSYSQVRYRFAYGSSHGGGRVMAVGGFRSNAFGLHNMHGNVCEWCSDRYRGSAPGSATGRPLGKGEVLRVFRGGSGMGGVQHARSAARSALDDVERYGFLGFRVVAQAAGGAGGDKGGGGQDEAGVRPGE